MPARSGAGLQVLCGMETEPLSGRSRPVAYLVERSTLMTGDVITDARPRPGTNVPGNISSTSRSMRGARICSRTSRPRTSAASWPSSSTAPSIRRRGSTSASPAAAVITGSFEIREAQDLAIVLRTGALPAPVVIAEERTVGPSLGRDSIRQGMLSFAVGGGLVILFMVVYYRGAG